MRSLPIFGKHRDAVAVPQAGDEIMSSGRAMLISAVVPVIGQLMLVHRVGKVGGFVFRLIDSIKIRH